MKVLLFTHEQDIDGMGCAVLANHAFTDLEVVPCKTFEITKKVQEYIDNKKINSFDKVFVTDLCIKEPLLTSINKNNDLKEKIQVIDHHKSEMDEGNDQYDFVSIIVEENGKKESGTSLFYKYLLKNKFLKQEKYLDTLVEWTRQYDVWDWKIVNNVHARYLHILFEELGYEEYLKIANSFIQQKEVSFNNKHLDIIHQFEKRLEQEINSILSNMKIVEVPIQNKNYRIGYVISNYKYRNDINEFVIQDNKYNIDTVSMIMTDMDTVSYRNVKDIDASIIASYFGGKGHKNAASNPKNNEKFRDLMKQNNITIP